MSPEQRRARRISAANRPENVPRPDKENGFVRAAPHRGRGAGPGERRARTRTVLQPIARCPTFALRPRKSFAIVHRDRSLRRSVSADRRHRWLRSAAPLRVLRWASRRDWARIGESRAEESGECSQDFQELRSSAGPGARRSGRPGPRSGQRQAGGAVCYTRCVTRGRRCTAILTCT